MRRSQLEMTSPWDVFKSYFAGFAVASELPIGKGPSWYGEVNSSFWKGQSTTQGWKASTPKHPLSIHHFPQTWTLSTQLSWCRKQECKKCSAKFSTKIGAKTSQDKIPLLPTTTYLVWINQALRKTALTLSMLQFLENLQFSWYFFIEIA